MISLFNSCSPTRRLNEGEYLLKKQKIIGIPSDLDVDEVQANLRQKPNRKLFGLFRFNLQMYNLPNPDKLPTKNAKKRAKVEAKNAKRKKFNEEHPKRTAKKMKEFKPARYWMREVVGEAPVLIDSSQVETSVLYLKKYLTTKGYFENTVRDSISYLSEKKKKGKVFYIIDSQEPYLISEKVFPMPEPIEALAKGIPKFPILKEGQRFDVDLMDDEREVIAKRLRNNGYFFFNKDLILFQADSTIGNNSVKLIAGISGANDSIPKDYLRTWTIGDISIEQIGLKSPEHLTRVLDNYTFLNADSLVVKPSAIVSHLLFKKGDYYKEDVVERTYRRLLALPIFSIVNISFSRSETPGVLNCSIKLRKGKKQSLSAETKGTNSSGFLGIEGDLVYRNRNVFKHAEVLTVKLRGGVQAQALVTDEGNENANNINLNTVEFGPEVSLQFPKFLLPIKQENFARSTNPKTSLLAAYNFQSRPDFSRTISNFNYGISWSETVTKKHYINFMEVSYININPTEGFTAYLENLNNRLLTDAYRNHFITSTLYGFNFNSQKRAYKRNAYFYQGTFKSSGSILRALHKAFKAESDSLGSYELFNIRFAQFLKTEHDFRYYHFFSSKNSIAIRFASGLGIPLRNLNVLPFSESFFAGGSTGIRAWQARSLGPGSFFEPNSTLDKIGDVHLEANLEYRFDIIDYFEGAFFYDMGNIWLLKEDPLRPGSAFRGDRFLDEIAMGAGIGLRLDFDFFIIRLDVGSQLKDPALQKGERWFYQDKTLYNAAIDDYNATLPDPANHLNYYRQQYTFNLGINYPF